MSPPKHALVMQDYKTPESKELARDLTAQLNVCIQFLVECRPLSISMGNAIKYLKLKVSILNTICPLAGKLLCYMLLIILSCPHDYWGRNSKCFIDTIRKE